ncbi:hypothetical protein U0070_027238 [Myodes glareolus]|uniref:Ras-GEF domain-containing protein n=1 Tax=Myodes glareolus TaxID=447135 RepID=A0AAW0H997_MYOGA
MMVDCQSSSQEIGEELINGVIYSISLRKGSDLSYVTVFLCTYRAFTTTQQVLDLLFKRSGGRAVYTDGSSTVQESGALPLPGLRLVTAGQEGQGAPRTYRPCTVAQFNNVANCVITTCLGDQSMKAPDRARVVEHWIEVARECRALKNFSSLYAILSALQSNAIHRLKKTWEEVSRDSFRVFQKLSEFLS